MVGPCENDRLPPQKFITASIRLSADVLECSGVFTDGAARQVGEDVKR
jgi:hypothetical protein